MITVLLEGKLYNFAMKLGIKRNDTKTISSGTKCCDSDETSHIIGAINEVAFAAYYKLLSHLNIKLYKNHGDKTDFGKIELKSSTWVGPDIELKVKVVEWANKRPEIYVLSRVYPDYSKSAKVDIIGYISRNDFYNHRRRKNYGHCDDYMVGVQHLTQLYIGITDPIFDKYIQELNRSTND